MDKQASWADLVLCGGLGAIGGVGMLAYLMEKMNRKRDFRRDDMNIRDYCVWIFITMRPCLVDIPENELVEHLEAHYDVIDKFIVKTDAYKKQFELISDVEENKHEVVMNKLSYGDLNLRDETVLVMMASNTSVIRNVLDENSNYIDKCYIVADTFIKRSKSYEKHQNYLVELENEYNKQKECSIEKQKECPIEGQNECKFTTEVESVDQKNTTEK